VSGVSFHPTNNRQHFDFMSAIITSSLSAETIAARAAEAYVFGFPALEMQRVRYNFLYAPGARLHTAPNTFRHVRKLATHNSREVTAPNNDTLYSSAWLDLSAGPVMLSVPEMSGRYFSYACMDFFTNVFALVSRRNSKAGDYLICGPGWNGEVPHRATRIESPTNAVWLLARFLVDGPDDFPAVYDLQDRSHLTAAPLPGNPALLRRQTMAINAATEENCARVFEVLNSILEENPPPAADAAILMRLAEIGIGPGFELASPSANTLESGVRQARMQMRQDARAVRHVAGPGGWTRPPMALGNYGTDYGLRAVTALVGLAALPSEEAMYFSALTDADGAPLHGENAYVLHFDGGCLPPAGAFWSLTMYEIDGQGRSWLVDNDLHRYAIGNRTPGLRHNADGSLDIYIGRDCANPSNLLPAAEGPFLLSLRVYEPESSLLDGSYTFPPVQRRK
jgi:hypothetical protein